MESAQGKNQALQEAGAVVPNSYEEFETAIKDTFEKLVTFSMLSRYSYIWASLSSTTYSKCFSLCFAQVEEGKISSVKEVKPPQIPEDLNTAIKAGKVRAPTHIISTISDDRGIIWTSIHF